MREELTNLRRFYGDHVPTLLEARHEYAVLCPLVERPNGLHLLFEVRSAGVSQSGETCFPGGQMEPGEAPADCALRETEEELSIPRAEIRLLGQGDFICNQRGFLLRPLPGLGWKPDARRPTDRRYVQKFPCSSFPLGKNSFARVKWFIIRPRSHSGHPRQAFPLRALFHLPLAGPAHRPRAGIP